MSLYVKLKKIKSNYAKWQGFDSHTVVDKYLNIIAQLKFRDLSQLDHGFSLDINSLQKIFRKSSAGNIGFWL